MLAIRFHPVLGAAALALFASGSFAQIEVPSAESLLLGTWTLDLSRSEFFGREAPRSQVMVFEPAGDGEGLRATVIFTDQDGTENRVSYLTEQEGEPMRLQGSENFDAIQMENRGPYLAVSTFTHAGRAVGQAERRISMDGKEMTVEVERNGNLSSRAVFVKQE